ncbi:MAG: TolC family protein [Prevotella sp.]|nr:TolC family protein [Prevotella sp.]
MNRSKFLVTLLLALSVNLAMGQSLPPQYVSMEEVVGKATKHNAQVRIAEMDRRISQAHYQQTDAVYLPQVSLGYTAMVTNNPLNAFGFLLQQGVATAQDFEPSRLNNPGATHNFGTSVDVKVPVVNLDMIYARKGTKLQQEVYHYKQMYTEAYVAYEVRKAYTQLQFAYEMRNILTATLSDVKQIHRTVGNFYSQGLVQQSDVLNAEVQVSTVESALSKAESNIDNASEGLKLLMNTGADSPDRYVVDSLSQVMTVTAGDAVIGRRPDIKAMETALDASVWMEKSARMAFLPKLNAFGSYQFNDSKVLGFRKGSYLAGISLSWNVFSGRQDQGKLKAAKAATMRQEQQLNLLKEESRLELNKSLRALHDSQKEIEKLQKSVGQAEEALRILNNRYREGLVSTTDCLQSQAQLSQQRMALAQAVMTYNITHYYIQLLIYNV